MIIPAESRATFYVGEWVPDELNVSTYVEAQDGLVVCERAMYGGDGDLGHGFHRDHRCSPTPGTWRRAPPTGGMQTYVLVQNPTAEDVHVNITFNTDIGDISPVDLQGVLIPAKSRRTFMVNGWVTTYNVSTFVECRTARWWRSAPCTGAVAPGPRIPSGRPRPPITWFLAEGSTDGGMQTYVLVQNPDTTTDARVNIVFQTGGGQVAPPDLQGVLIPAGSRSTFMVNGWLTTFDVSTMVVATEGQVMVERAMYGRGSAWATDSIGY